MNTVLKIILALILGLVALILIAITYVKVSLPDVGDAPELTISATPELVARGKYLANSVSVCMDCHSTRDWMKFSGPLVPGTLGQGGEVFNQDFGFPGSYTSKNITPFAMSSWSDGELYRAITSGVSKDGHALFPIMPYQRYGKMAKEDVHAIIAYIRTLAPLEKSNEPSISDFPMNLIINTIPQAASHESRPEKSDVIAYGEYITNAAACGDCHTPQDKGEPIAGMDFAGGFEFKMPYFGIVRSANISPDSATGIGSWDEATFVARFKSYADSSYIPHSVSKSQFQTVMPWMMYASMEEDDLKAIFAYLKSITPVENKVVKFTSF